MTELDTWSVWACWNSVYGTERFAVAGGFKTEQEALAHIETLPPASEKIGEPYATYEVWPDD